ncbi:MAG TPA: non-lysosomal glucosylceramidase [Brevefilum sp.]
MADITDIKKYAWELPLWNKPNRKTKPLQVTPKFLWDMVPGMLRIRRWARKQRRQGRKPLFDLVMGDFKVTPDKGVPLGGLGCGSITRGCFGDFNRWALKPGDYSYRTVAANQFSLRVSREGTNPHAIVLNPNQPKEKILQDWGWGLDPARVTYRALFPRAWHDYQDPLPGLKLSCRQVSPVIPHNYRESSFPVSTFIWCLENTGMTDADLSLMFTFQNGTGGMNDSNGGHTNHPINKEAESGDIVGIELRHKHRHPKPLSPGQKLSYQSYYEDRLSFGLGAINSDEVHVSRQTWQITPAGAKNLWQSFLNRGELPNHVDQSPSQAGTAIGAAVCAQVSIPPGESREIVFALVWDMPVARFPGGTGWRRRYTKFYGDRGDAVPALLKDALTRYPAWEDAIDAWQIPILEDEGLPLWYRQMLFNETYYLVDGGTIWTAGKVGDDNTVTDAIPEPAIGHFAYLESHEYRMYNTYDVHFYASFALAMLWPELELGLQRDFAHALDMADDEIVTYFFSGSKAPRKVPGLIPHDLGSSLEEPWAKINAYNAQDVSRWKDLNPKFVLQIARDYALTKDREFMQDLWPAVQNAVEHMYRFDKDDDGMIENDGFPDQTYDVWTAEGPSAYAGGLWLACLQAAARLADVLGYQEQASGYRKDFERAQKVYERLLWNGEYYNYDATTSKHHDSIMADQLAGHWYSQASGLGGMVPKDHARSALANIFDLNVMGYEDGRLGAMNGMRPDGELDKTCMQSMEIWTGTTFALAAAMLQAGLNEEAFKTAEGIYNMVYEDYGLWFQTPEALSAHESVRAISYMRPLAIWAIQWELEGLSNRILT